MVIKWLKHAFALDDGSSGEPTEKQSEAIDRVLREIVRRRLEIPAGMLLESCRPLNYVAAQVLKFFSPMMQLVLDSTAQNEFAVFLENRKSVDYLLRRLDTIAKQPAPGTSTDSETEHDSDSEQVALMEEQESATRDL